MCIECSSNVFGKAKVMDRQTNRQTMTFNRTLVSSASTSDHSVSVYLRTRYSNKCSKEHMMSGKTGQNNKVW